MNSLYTLPNEVSSLTTETVKACTHTLRSILLGFGERDVDSVPSESRSSNPSTLSTRRSNPDPGLTAIMDNCKSPLGLKTQYIGVQNQLSSQRVYDLDLVSFENEFWSNPDYINKHTENEADDKFKSCLNWVRDNKETICSKKNNKYQRNTSPDKVTSGSKSFIHYPIIAGVGR